MGCGASSASDPEIWISPMKLSENSDANSNSSTTPPPSFTLASQSSQRTGPRERRRMKPTFSDDLDNRGSTGSKSDDWTCGQKRPSELPSIRTQDPRHSPPPQSKLSGSTQSTTLLPETRSPRMSLSMSVSRRAKADDLENSRWSRASTVFQSESLGRVVQKLGTGKLSALITHLETLQAQGNTSFDVNNFLATPGRSTPGLKPVASWLVSHQIFIVPDIQELLHLATTKKSAETERHIPEFHSDEHVALDRGYLMHECTLCEHMLHSDSSQAWSPHWADPPGPPLEGLSDSVLSSSCPPPSDSGIRSQQPPAASVVVEYLETAPVLSKLVDINGELQVVSTLPGALSKTPAVLFEVAALKEIRHESLTRLLGVLEEPDGAAVHVVSSFAARKLHAAGDQPLELAGIRRTMYGLLQGLQALHVNGVCHGGVRLETVLRSESGAPVLHEPGAFFRGLVPASAASEAAERGGFRVFSHARDAKADDMWNMGVYCYHLATGRRPCSVSGVETRGSPAWESIGCPVLADFIASLLEVEDGERLDVYSALEHAFFDPFSGFKPALKTVLTENMMELAIGKWAFGTSPSRAPGDVKSRPRLRRRNLKARLLTEEEMHACDDVEAHELMVTAVKDRREELVLNRFKFEQVPPGVLACVALKSLVMTLNNLSCLTPAVASLTNLTSLNVSRNALTSLPSQLSDLPFLTHLDACSNCLSSLPESFSRLSLREARFEYNYFTEPPAPLAQVRCLRKLLLARNHITSLPKAWLWERCVVGLDNSPKLVDEARARTDHRGFTIEWHNAYPNRVADFIFLGTLRTAQDPDIIRELGISTIYTIGKGLPVASPLPPGVEHRVLPVDDTPATMLLGCFDEAAAFLEEATAKRSTVLVHCFAGRSRSVTVLCAYFIKYYSMPFKEALSFIKEARPSANPNIGFRRQLIDYEEKVLGTRLHADDVENRPNDPSLDPS
ncbi:hypothetical protein DIPPA_01096 [Diplonema papillatum]|nr:hypothetical protein DIPPA_01096 [Diplonema papillatum]